MSNKVEILRSLCFTKEDLLTIQNLFDFESFSEKDVEFIVEFKKIYELGLNQLESFINKLHEEGKQLDETTIQYYVTLLLNGPLGQYARTLAKDKNYFIDLPDTLGFMGNKGRTSANTGLFENYEFPLGCSVDLQNKLPGFMQTNLSDMVKQTESMFRDNVKHFMVIDNTLPMVDKRPQERYYEESTGVWVTRAPGTYMIKDSYFYNILDIVNETLFDQILEFLGEENNRIFKYNKSYNAFDSDKNDSTSTNFKVKKLISNQEVTLDLMGNMFDSEERRKSALKVSSPEKDKEYSLGTVEGQLGN